MDNCKSDGKSGDDEHGNTKGVVKVQTTKAMETGYAAVRYLKDQHEANVPVSFIKNYSIGNSISTRKKYLVFWSNDSDSPSKLYERQQVIPEIFDENEESLDAGYYLATVSMVKSTLEELQKSLSEKRAPKPTMKVITEGSFEVPTSRNIRNRKTCEPKDNRSKQASKPKTLSKGDKSDARKVTSQPRNADYILTSLQSGQKRGSTPSTSTVASKRARLKEAPAEESSSSSSSDSDGADLSFSPTKMRALERELEVKEFEVQRLRSLNLKLQDRLFKAEEEAAEYKSNLENLQNGGLNPIELCQTSYSRPEKNTEPPHATASPKSSSPNSSPNFHATAPPKSPQSVCPSSPKCPQVIGPDSPKSPQSPSASWPSTPTENRQVKLPASEISGSIIREWDVTSEDNNNNPDLEVNNNIAKDASATAKNFTAEAVSSDLKALGTTNKTPRSGKKNKVGSQSTPKVDMSKTYLDFYKKKVPFVLAGKVTLSSDVMESLWKENTGPNGDSLFIKNAAVAAFGSEHLATHVVTGIKGSTLPRLDAEVVEAFTSLMEVRVRGENDLIHLNERCKQSRINSFIHQKIKSIRSSGYSAKKTPPPLSEP